MTIKMTVQYDRSHDDKMTSESLTLWLMTITALSWWQDDNHTMVDYNAMALCHQWQTGTFFVDDNDFMTRVMMTGWQAGHYG